MSELSIVTLNLHGGQRSRRVSTPRLRQHGPPPEKVVTNGAFDVAGALRSFDADGTVNEERLQQYKQRFGAMSPLGRIGTPEDIAWTILYLVSDAASFVTGQTIRPNGGVSMPW